MMIRHLTITNKPVNEAELLRQRPVRVSMGAVVYFLGVVRDTEEGAPIRGIEYEAFLSMVEHQFELIFRQIEQRWPIDSIRLVHRIGLVQVAEPSLWVEVVAPHRSEAFAACEFLIDEMKRVVPIWKKCVG
jgi:molybdopterin synthase catalytic subunit